MSIHAEEKVFDAYSIRNTANHNSSTFECTRISKKTVYVINDLNQDVLIKMRLDIDGTFNNPTGGGQATISKNSAGLLTLDEYVPFMRLRASCSIAPTTGDLTCYILGVS